MSTFINHWTSIKSQKKFFYIDKFIETENGKIKRKEMLEASKFFRINGASWLSVMMLFYRNLRLTVFL
jgi:hypothetical protein